MSTDIQFDSTEEKHKKITCDVYIFLKVKEHNNYSQTVLKKSDTYIIYQSKKKIKERVRYFEFVNFN